MAFAYVDLVDGDLPQVAQVGSSKTALQVAFLDVLDDVPTDVQVPGHGLDGHMVRQLQGIALEGTGVAPARIGETEVHLADQIASPAADALYRQHQGHTSPANGNSPQTTLDHTAANDVAGTTSRTSPMLGRLADGEQSMTRFILGANVLIATDAKGMVQ